MLVIYYVEIFVASCGLVWVGFLIGRNKKIPTPLPIKEIKKEEEAIDLDLYKDCRRGIFEECTSYTNNTSKCQFEIIELERTTNKSKILIPSIKNIKFYHPLGNDVLNRIKDMYDNKWIETNKIEWIINTEKVRDKKIEEILKKEENGTVN